MGKYNALLGHIFILVGIILATWWLLVFSNFSKPEMLAGSLGMISGFRFVYFSDPEGNIIELNQLPNK